MFPPKSSFVYLVLLYAIEIVSTIFMIWYILYDMIIDAIK